MSAALYICVFEWPPFIVFGFGAENGVLSPELPSSDGEKN